jgi:hypothetical protein
MEAGEFSPVGFAAMVSVIRFLVAGLIGSRLRRGFEISRVWFSSAHAARLRW